jgi:hypothetical protein
MASKNEKAAAKLGISLKEYKAKKNKSSSSSKKSSSKDEKKAKKEVKKYYEEKTGFAKEEKALSAKQVQEDLNNVFLEAGITKTRAMEDYVTNIGNIEANKTLDNKTLSEYVSSERGKTTEDLATSLAKESRRYSIESDKINQDLADKGLTFSERTPEQIAKGDYAQNTADINTEANRSFADIARYEATKTAETSLKYGQLTSEAESKKTRTLEDVINDQEEAQRAAALKNSSLDLSLKQTLSDVGYQKSDKLSDISNYYDEQKNYLEKTAEKTNQVGV